MPQKSQTTATKGNTANSEGISEGKKRRLANLKPFKPGQSGNPGGRPKNPLTDALRHRLAEIVPGDPKKRTWAAVAAQAKKGVRVA